MIAALISGTGLAASIGGVMASSDWTSPGGLGSFIVGVVSIGTLIWSVYSGVHERKERRRIDRHEMEDVARREAEQVFRKARERDGNK